MNKQDLTDILLKISGFLMLFRALLFLPQSLIAHGAYLFTAHGSLQSHTWLQLTAALVGTAIQIAGGVFLVRKSSGVSRWLLGLGSANIDNAEQHPGG